MPRAGSIYSRKESAFPLYRRLGGPVWTDKENLAPTGIRFPDRPACSEPLYRLGCPDSPYISNFVVIEVHGQYFYALCLAVHCLYAKRIVIRRKMV